MQTILSYSFKTGVIANPDGTSLAQVTDCKAAIGPGATILGTFPEALDFATTGRIEAKLPGIPSEPKFSIRLLLKVGPCDNNTQTLFLCHGLGLSLTLEKGNTASTAVLAANINNAQSGWSTVSTTVNVQQWLLIDVAYDMDTLALFASEQLLGIAAFPMARLAASSDNSLILSGRKNTQGNRTGQFMGQMAALQIIDGIPENLENLLDAQRGTPAWNISLKANQLQPSINLGQPVDKPKKDAKGGYFKQPFQQGMVFFDPADGQSAGMRGAIYDYWKLKPAVQVQLGNLLFDEMDAGRPQTRKSVFENGAIYWSAETGAVPIIGKKMMSDYVKMGEAGSIVGLPKASATGIPGGLWLECQRGVLYYNEKSQNTVALPTAEESRYAAEGGHAKWGLPVSSPCEILDGVGAARKSIGTTTKLGKNAAIFRKKGASKAYLLFGNFLDKYLSDAVGGPAGTLGFPTAELKTISPTVRHLAFENGAIVHIGTNTISVPTFNLRVQRVETASSEKSGLIQGENDLYMYCTVQENGREVYKKRYPTNGEVEKNTVEPQFVTQNFNPNDSAKKLELSLDVWESDAGDDDHMGAFNKVLDVTNAWGLLDDALGLFNSGKVSKIINIVWAVQPEVTERTPYDFWNTGNHSTATISEAQYAAAFFDVDPDPEWYSPADWLRIFYYEVYVKNVASTGNCHGLSTEAIYAWKNRSLFGRPLARFTDFARIENEINLRHCSQAGAESLGWVVGQFAKNNMHDPKTVFKETRNFHASGENPVLCLSTNWKFGDGHVILPIAWDDSKPIWEITVFDPNDNNTKKILYIDPVKNTYTYKTKYAGGAGWDNIKKGFLYYIPWSMLDSIPYTPISGLPQFFMAILSSGLSQTLSVLGMDGQNMYANQSPESMAGNMDGKFLLVPKMQGSPNGELLLNTASSGAKLPTDFDHTLQGLGNGALEYGLTFKRQSFKLKSTIAKAEQNTVGMKKLGTPQQLTTLLSPNNKLMSLTTGQKMGSGKDYVRIDVNQIPVKAGLAAQLNHQPGGNSLDILSSAEAVNAQVVISGSTNGKTFRQEYDTRLEGGTRLLFSHAMSSNVLKVGKIDQVFGAMQAPKFVQKK